MAISFNEGGISFQLVRLYRSCRAFGQSAMRSQARGLCHLYHSLTDQMDAQPNSNRKRIVPIALCTASVGVCFLYAATRSELPQWWSSHGGGIPYVLFFIFLVYTIFPQPKRVLRICTIVVLATCGLEVLQLWNPEPLASFRKTTFGAALLGSKFVWGDFPPYFIGGAVGFVILRLVTLWKDP